MKNKTFKAKNILILSLLFFLVMTPALAQENGNNGSNNNNNNPGQEGSTGNPGTSNNNSNNGNKASNNSNNSNSQGNPGNSNSASSKNSSQGNPGENSPQNNGSVNSKTNNANRQRFNSSSSNSSSPSQNLQSLKLSVSNGTIVTFGDNDENEVSEETSTPDQDVSDDLQVIHTGKVSNISSNNHSFSIGSIQNLSVTPSLFTFLADNGLISDGSKVQVKINKSSGNSNNTVEFLRIFSTTGGPDLMIRLHTNNQVNQLSVKAKPSSPVGGFLSSIMSFLSSLLSGGTSPSPSPSPSLEPSSSPSASPSSSPSESPSASPEASTSPEAATTP